MTTKNLQIFELTNNVSLAYMNWWCTFFSLVKAKLLYWLLYVTSLSHLTTNIASSNEHCFGPGIQLSHFVPDYYYHVKLKEICISETWVSKICYPPSSHQMFNVFKYIPFAGTQILLIALFEQHLLLCIFSYVTCVYYMCFSYSIKIIW